jgi:hypothetical protein
MLWLYRCSTGPGKGCGGVSVNAVIRKAQDKRADARRDWAET